MLNIGWWCSKPSTDSKLSLGSFPVGLCVIHCLRQIICPYLFRPTLLPPLTPSLLPNSLNFKTPMLPPSPRHPHSHPPHRLQEQIRNRASCYLQSKHIFFPGYVRIYLLQCLLSRLFLQQVTGGTSRSHWIVAVFSYLYSAVPTSGRTSPGSSKYGESPTTPLRKKSGFTKPWSGRSVPMYTHTLSNSPVS